MDTKTGKVRALQENEQPRPGEVEVKTPRPDCPRCGGEGSVPVDLANRAERRRAYNSGVPQDAKYIPCPLCNEG
jgi:hypothetical protein